MLFDREALGLPLAAAAAITRTLVTERPVAVPDPFERRDGWRSHGEYLRRFDFEFRGAEQIALLTYKRDGTPVARSRRRAKGPLVVGQSAVG